MTTGGGFLQLVGGGATSPSGAPAPAPASGAAGTPRNVTVLLAAPRMSPADQAALAALLVRLGCGSHVPGGLTMRLTQRCGLHHKSAPMPRPLTGSPEPRRCTHAGAPRQPPCRCADPPANAPAAGTAAGAAALAGAGCACCSGCTAAARKLQPGLASRAQATFHQARCWTYSAAGSVRLLQWKASQAGQALARQARPGIVVRALGALA